MSYIYFIQSSEGPVKIGFSNSDPKLRLEYFQVGNPNELKLLGYIVGTRKQELNLHKQFEYLCIRGEWFKPDLVLLSHIKTLLELRGTKIVKTVIDAIVFPLNLDATLASVEYELLSKALQAVENNHKNAAKLLGLSYRAFRHRISKYADK